VARVARNSAVGEEVNDEMTTNAMIENAARLSDTAGARLLWRLGAAAMGMFVAIMLYASQTYLASLNSHAQQRDERIQKIETKQALHGQSMTSAQTTMANMGKIQQSLIQQVAKNANMIEYMQKQQERRANP
jgi:hypothetical protein